MDFLKNLFSNKSYYQRDSAGKMRETDKSGNFLDGLGDTPKPVNIQQPQVQQLDQDVVRLAKAIRQHESGGDFNAKGASGENGGYQFMPNTWKEWAGEVLGDPNAPLSKENQNKVAYQKIKSWKDQGLNPAEIASKWNSGSTNWQGKVGVNQFGVRYNTPDYVDKVTAIYQQLKSQEVPTSQLANASNSFMNTPIGANVAYASDGQNTPQPKTFGGFLKNTVGSAGNFIGGLATAVLNPIDTVSTLGKLGYGAVSNVGQAIGLNDGTGEYNKLADTVGQSYKERYGGLSNIGQTLYEDPVGVLADATTFLSGGAGVAGKVGQFGKLGKASEVANVLNKTSRVIDPLTYIGKAGSKTLGGVGNLSKNLAFQGVGVSTGRGAGTFEQIFNSAREGRKGAVNAMRAGSKLDDISMVNKLDEAVNELNSIKSQEFKKLGLDKQTTQLDVSPIFRQAEKGLNDFNIGIKADGTLDFSRSKIRFDKKAQGDIQNIVDTMSDYGLRKGDRSPLGVDNLKQAFSSLYSESSQVRSFVEAMRKETRKVLSKVKGYDEYSARYGEIQELLGQLKSELSAGNKNASQTWRKISNTFKQRNTQGRVESLNALQKLGISDLIDEIAGYNAQRFVPEDSLRVFGGGYLVVGNPLILPTLSPRIVGEASNFLGNTFRKADELGAKAKDYGNTTKTGGVIKYLGGQVYNKNKATRSSTLLERSEEED